MSESFAFSLRKKRCGKTPSPIASGDYSASRLATKEPAPPTTLSTPNVWILPGPITSTPLSIVRVAPSAIWTVDWFKLCTSPACHSVLLEIIWLAAIASALVKCCKDDSQILDFKSHSTHSEYFLVIVMEDDEAKSIKTVVAAGAGLVDFSWPIWVFGFLGFFEKSKPIVWTGVLQFIVVFYLEMSQQCPTKPLGIKKGLGVLT
jgi:hypothetical protein